MVDFAQQMSQTNFQAYVPQDRTGEIMAAGEQRAAQAQVIGSNMLAKGIEAGVDVWNAYEVSKFTSDMNKLNEEYMGSRTTSPMLARNQTALDKMTSALEQGAMTPQEYNTRVRALTREAINRAPAFTQDFIRQADRVFEYSGMKTVLDFDTEMMKSQQASMAKFSENIFNLAKEAGIPRDYSRATDETYLISLQNAANQVINSKSTFEGLKTQAETKAIWTKQDIDSAFAIGPDGKTLISKAFTGSNLATNENLQGIFSAVTDEKTFAAAKLQAQQFIIDQENDFISALSAHIDDPRVKTMIDNLKATNKTRLDALNSFASKEDALKYVQNSMNLFKDQSYMDYYERNGINPQQEDAMIRLMQTPNLASIISQGKFTQFQTAIQGLIDRNLNAFSDPKLIKSVVDGAITQLGTNPTIDEIVNGYATSLIQNRGKLSGQQTYNLGENYISSLATGDPDKIKLMSEAGKQDALTIISANAKITFESMLRDLDASSGGKPIKVEVYPDGRLYLDGEISGEVKARYTTRINKALQAMANVMGSDVKTVAKDYFYPTVTGNKVMGDKQAQPAPTPTSTAAPAPSASAPQESAPLLTPAPVTQADINYGAAQDAAAKQREQFYGEVAKATGIGMDRAKESLEGTLDFITNNILPNIGGQDQIKSASETLDKLLQTILPKLDIRWDWEHYHKTGELKRRSETRSKQQ